MKLPLPLKAGCSTVLIGMSTLQPLQSPFNYSPAYSNPYTPSTPSMIRSTETSQDSPEVDFDSLSKAQKYQLKFSKYKCAVCGDEATGFHYGVNSCNGCGSFFRRTIMGRRSFVCCRGGLCSLSKDVRCACRACRFAKCKAVGMNSSFPSNKSQDGEMNHPDYYKLPLTPPVLGLDSEQMKLLDSLNQREMGLLAIRNGCAHATCPDYSLDYLLDPDFQTPSNFRMLNNQTNKDPVLYWAVVDLYIAVEFAKTFQEFNCIPKSDQLILIHKSAGTIQLLTQSYYSFQHNSDCLVFPDGSKPPRDEFEDHFREYFVRPVDYCRRVKMKIQELVLIKGLLLFMDDGDLSIEARKVIQSTRENLISLFTKYTMSQYGVFRGPEKMAELLTAVPGYVDLAEKKRNYWDVLKVTRKARYPQLVEDILFYCH